MKKVTLALTALLLGLAGCSPTAGTRASGAAMRPIKVLIISMFKPEGDVWIKPLALQDYVAIPGLSPDYPTVKCNAAGVCLLTTGMGHANAAASITALVFSRRFDLSHSYFLIAGIAGIDPNMGTIGSAAWARYLIDYGIAHEIDLRELGKPWHDGYFGIDAPDPQTKPPLDYRTEIFQLNESLLQWALSLSQNARLDDSDKARAYRTHYAQAPASSPPAVIQCDTAAGDTYWHGNILGERAEAWTALLTGGKGRYCTTQQEDNATYEGLQRGANAGLLDIQRLAVLRTGANFDRPYPGENAYDSLKSDSGGFQPALNNLVSAGRPLINEIVNHWDRWAAGIPQMPAAAERH